MLMKKTAITVLLALSMLSLSGCAREAKEVVETGPQPPPVNSLKPVRVSADGTDAAEPTVASGTNGSIFVAWVEHRQNKEADVMLAELDGEGQMKLAPVRVNPQAGTATAWRGDPPTVAVATDGTIYVGWTARVAAEGYANDLYLSVSRDHGKSFEPPVKVNDDGKKVAHAMHSLALSADNRVYVVWLDERNVVMPPAEAKGKKMEHMEANREVFFAASLDGGRTFSKNMRVGQEACPCCKTAVTAGKDGRVYASWRQVLPGEFRHIALAASEDGGKTFSKPVIVSDDRWMTASCPVSGPALSALPEGTLRVVWYTEGEKGEPGLYWAESRDQGKTFSESKTLAKGQARGNPLLLETGKSGPRVVWESNEGSASRVMLTPLFGAGGGASAPPVETSGQLPSATVSGQYLYVGYISKINDRRSIWILRAEPLV